MKRTHRRIIMLSVFLGVFLLAPGCSTLNRIDERVQNAKEEYLQIRAVYQEIRSAYLSARQVLAANWDRLPPEAQRTLAETDEKACQMDARLLELDRKITTTYYTYEEIQETTLLVLETIKVLSGAIRTASDAGFLHR